MLWDQSGSQLKKSLYFIAYCLHSSVSENLSQQQSHLPISKWINSQHHFNRLLILMGFLDIKKLTLHSMPLESFLSCLELCLEILGMEVCYFRLGFGWPRVLRPRRLYQCCMELGIWCFWWGFSRFIRVGFIISFSPCRLMYLEAVMERLITADMLIDKKLHAFILLDLILNGSEHQMILTSSTLTKWSLQ